MEATMNVPTSVRSLLVLLALAIVSCSRERPTTHETDRAGDESAIRAVLDANERATNRRDSKGVADTFTSNADLMVANGPTFVGVGEIQRNEKEFYSTPGFQKWNATVESIRFLSDDVAMVEQIATTTLDSGVMRDKATVVMLRTEDGWKIAAVRVLGRVQS